MGIYAIIFAAIGFVVGYGTRMVCTARKDGIFRVDNHDPDKTVYRLDLTRDLDKIERKHVVRLVVDRDANLTQDSQ